MSGTIHVTREGEHVALLAIDNPPRNTLGTAMRAQLREALTRLAADLSVRAVVVTGSGKAFCSGDDLREEFAAVAGGGEPGANLLDFARLLDQVEAFSYPRDRRRQRLVRRRRRRARPLLRPPPRVHGCAVRLRRRQRRPHRLRLPPPPHDRHRQRQTHALHRPTLRRRIRRPLRPSQRPPSSIRSPPRSATVGRPHRLTRPALGGSHQTPRQRCPRPHATTSTNRPSRSTRHVDHHHRSPDSASSLSREAHPHLHPQLARPPTRRARGAAPRGGDAGGRARRIHYRAAGEAPRTPTALSNDAAAGA